MMNKVLITLALGVAMMAMGADALPRNHPLTQLAPADRKFSGFDVHFYFFAENDDSKASGLKLHEAFKAAFPHVKLDEPHFAPIGPHPIAMWEANPTQEQIGDVIVWLMANHAEHTVLVHPHSGDEIYDHTTGALWFGQKIPLEFNKL